MLKRVFSPKYLNIFWYLNTLTNKKSSHESIIYFILICDTLCHTIKHLIQTQLSNELYRYPAPKHSTLNFVFRKRRNMPVAQTILYL